MQVIKLGGSVITNKDRYKSFRRAVAVRLAKEIARAKTPTVIVHGAGSFGHILAQKHDLSSGHKSIGQLKGFAEVHRDVRELNNMVSSELIKAGINAVSIPPSSFIKADGGQIRGIETARFEEFLELGLTPVAFGDVVLDSQMGFCICSGDVLVYHIARNLDARRAIFVTDVDGIYGTHRGRRKILAELESLDHIGKLKKPGQKKKDVTGGIKGKAKVMLELGGSGIESVLINGNKKGRLLRALRGEQVTGTFVHSRVK